MKKKIVSVLLAMATTSLLLAGCGNGAAEEGAGAPTPAGEEGEDEADAGSEEGEEGGDQADAGSEADGEEDLAEITVAYWTMATAPQETELVEEAINEITEAEIGVTVHLNIMEGGVYTANGAMANGVANGEDYDLVLTSPALSGHYQVMMANGMLMPITDLLEEYAPELMATVPEDFMTATSKDGEIYGVSPYCNKVRSMYWICRNSVLDAAGIDIHSIKTIDDIEAALLKIQETSPDMIPLSGETMSLNLTFPGFTFGAGDTVAGYDDLGEVTAVAAAVYHDDETHTAVSRYETDEFKTDIQYLKKWYDAGLVDKDVATDTATGVAILEKDNIASEFAVMQFDSMAVRGAAADASYVELSQSVVGTGSMQQFSWAVPVSCDEPEAAVKFMNMLFTDERIVNLVDYGVEDVHWEKKADGTIGFPEGLTSESSGYYMGAGITALLGNGFLAYPWEGAAPETPKLAKEIMDNATFSPMLGFTLDTDALGDAYTALCPIANREYGPALFCGSAPDGYYEEFIQKMYAAGLEEYLAEVNRQIQAWMAEQQ